MNENEYNQELEEIEQVLEDVELEENQEETIEEGFEEEIQSGGYEYYEANYVRTKPLGRLILLVAFTAIMLVTSTYAWFSTQKNVTLGGLAGKVEVAEGLQISLDALNWRNNIDLSDAGIAAYFAASNAENGTAYDLDNPYNGRTNLVPEELLPVSTTAQTNEGIGLNDIKMYVGEVNNTEHLINIKEAEAENDSGYYAIDFFLWNTSGS